MLVIFPLKVESDIVPPPYPKIPPLEYPTDMSALTSEFDILAPPDPTSPPTLSLEDFIVLPVRTFILSIVAYPDEFPNTPPIILYDVISYLIFKFFIDAGV